MSGGGWGGMKNPVSPDAPFAGESQMVQVLAGGGTRLSAHVGVIAALNEMQTRFHDICWCFGGEL